MIADRYELGDVIGTGGMGVVRTGRDTKLDRPVAIKFLRADLAEQPDLRARFEAEARAAARISHPNVVSVFDTGEHEGIPYIVMELLSGKSLAGELAGGPLEPGRVRKIGLEILSALDAFHTEGILHRDLKPDNVLLATDGTVKVSDFGVAKITEGMDLTMAGTMLGTPAYLAPERVAGEPASAASDVYSAGVVLYELLTDTRPFEGDTPLGLLRAIQHDDPPSLTEARPDLERDLVAAIEKAMAKDPVNRYSDASSMARDLGMETSVEVLESTQVIEVPGSATQVISEPVPFPLPEPKLPPPPPSSTERERPTNPRLKQEQAASRAPWVRSGWQRMGRRRRIGVLAWAAVVLVVLFSMLRSDPADVQAPITETPRQADQSASMEDALDRLEDAVRP